MLTSALLVALWAASALAEPLLTVLQANGLTNFAKWLQEDPPFDPSAAGRRVIVYAPTNQFLPRDGDVTVARRQTEGDAQRERERREKEYHAANQESVVFKRGVLVPEGSVYDTLLSDPDWVNLGPGCNQRIVEKHVGLTSAPVVLTGLGESVKVTANDIPFDDGVVRPISGVFMLPGNLSYTLPFLHADAFRDALQEAGLLSDLDNRPLITVLAPTNGAFKDAASLASAELAELLKEHVLVGVPAYTPLLTEGRTFRTLGGSKVTIELRDGIASINGAKIIAGDAIITNGVVHTIGKPTANATTATPSAVITGPATTGPLS
ncbi:hypothetical protein DL765_003921 [Monosporascus sp. GIB2]|nr:hypothetical protein DL765_003921 [Monosporascus sp. GIB2]